MDTIICPNCKKPLELTKALREELEEQLRAQLSKQIEERLKEDLAFKLKDSQNELDEAKKRNRELHEQLLETNALIRSLKEQNERRDLETQKKLQEEIEKEKDRISKSEAEKAHLKVAELEKKLTDAQKSLEEAQRKTQQSSQQLQGEVLELEVEHVLKETFPHDDIQAVEKGISGADIKHTVKSPRGIVCGTILWESKRTKDWSDKWIPKLKEDTIKEKAHLCVIVSAHFPKGVKSGFYEKDGVWICEPKLVIPLAMLLRKNILDVAYQKAVSAHQDTKADLLYSYVTSHEFRQQIESILGAYKDAQEQIQKEQAALTRIWKQREEQAKRILASTARIIGSMQGKIGPSMLSIKSLDLIELDSGKEE